MSKFLTLSLVALMFVFPLPVSAATETSAGIKPGQFLYFFDTTFEKVNLFFTFGSENKAKKALEYADERLAEAKESANENNPKAVEKAMAGYKEEISLATEKSKELKDQNKVEELLNIVSENTAKHQEVLAGVLEKVPEEAKQAILNAIEVSKKGQAEAIKQITELKGEIEKLKKEVEELKNTRTNPPQAPDPQIESAFSALQTTLSNIENEPPSKPISGSRNVFVAKEFSSTIKKRAVQDWMRQNPDIFSSTAYINRFNIILTSYGLYDMRIPL